MAGSGDRVGLEEIAEILVTVDRRRYAMLRCFDRDLNCMLNNFARAKPVKVVIEEMELAGLAAKFRDILERTRFC